MNSTRNFYYCIDKLNMKYYFIKLLFYKGFVLIFFTSFTSCAQINHSQNYLVLYTDTSKEEYGYKNQAGDMAIPLGKYSFCFTDTFRTFAIVAKPGFGFVGIDRKENFLYEVFPFDNGPDYTSDGLFRIIENNKIGFADSASGKIVIKPIFDCAFPFENGKAKVSTNCKVQSNGEHSIWVSQDWFYIDKKGKKVKNPKKAEQ